MLMQSRLTNRSLEKGQSLVEMAFGFLFILIVVLGMLDLGRLYFIYIALEDSAGEAALFLALNANCAEEGLPECTDPNNARYRAETASNLRDGWDNADIIIDLPEEGSGVGGTVKVTIKYPFKLLTPVISDIVGEDTLVLTAEATQTIVSE